MRATRAVVLAAGEGTRMRSPRPKPLHLLCGRPMVSFVLDALNDVQATFVVVGHGATWVEKELRERHGDALSFVEQTEQLGTGHAVATALPAILDEAGDADIDVVILPGDTPLLRRATLAELVTRHQESQAAMTVLSAVLEDPSGYGRIVRDRDGRVTGIVEERDASAEERQIHEVNTSVMVVRGALLGPGLRRVGRQNAQHEYYLTDLVAVLHEAGHATAAVVVDDALEVMGVNDRSQLAAAEREMRRRINERWMQRGVTMWDPRHTYVDADVELSADVSLLPGTVLRGRTSVAAGAVIGPHAHLEDVTVGEGAHLATVTATRAVVGARARVGAYAVLEAGVVLEAGARVAPGEHRSA
ncbi:MAG: bifunctional N-acetylglucosamine-1-phosphate uridyltransferase/glucosamine-1-phosphate acetyltransferase [Acidobacteriota bacterium]|nr:bifunctional N-acetylglucosamine-1-phosphate uridyltransferase/glucosamine-1-phosphate acetyltransferase [Acidobacteriota bacterium]